MPAAEPELRAEDAYEWTQGRVVFADRIRRHNTPIATADGSTFSPGMLHFSILMNNEMSSEKQVTV